MRKSTVLRRAAVIIAVCAVLLQAGFYLANGSDAWANVQASVTPPTFTGAPMPPDAFLRTYTVWQGIPTVYSGPLVSPHLTGVTGSVATPVYVLGFIQPTSGGAYAAAGSVRATVYKTAKKYVATYTAPRSGKLIVRAMHPGDATVEHGVIYSSGMELNVIPPVTNPIAPVSARKDAPTRVTGKIYGGHTAGTYPVRIYKWFYNGSSWSPKGYVLARYNADGTYGAYMTFPMEGKWRLRAFHVTHDTHTSSWSPGVDQIVINP